MNVTGNVRDIIFNAYDRLDEAHWHIHQMENNYHYADPFRFALNSFLRSLKEVPQILQMELQNKEGFKDWYKQKKVDTYNDPLIKYFFKQRDLVVHRSMLKPKSTATVGITEGRGMKLGLGIPLDPLRDSDIGMLEYIYAFIEMEKSMDPLGMLGDDEEQLPCVERHWGLEGFDRGVIELAVEAWEKVSELIKDTIIWLGEDPSQLMLKIECIHESDAVAFWTYKKEWLDILIKAIKAGKDFYEVSSILRMLRVGY